MAKSKIQFQKGYSLFEFLKDYGTEAQCENALFTWRFPNGFVCPECANKTCCRLRRRPRVWQCNHCRHQMSLTGNTIFANTKLPLTKWFLAMHLLSQTKTGLSAMELKRQLGVKYDTAWMLKHKLLQAMKESDDKQPISGIIQLDDVYWGGERRGGKRGRGAAGKTPFVAAVALNKEGHPIKMRMTVVDGFKTKSVADWAKRHIASGSAVISDGLACFKAVKEANCDESFLSCCLCSICWSCCTGILCSKRNDSKVCQALHSSSSCFNSAALKTLLSWTTKSFFSVLIAPETSL